MQSVQSPPGFPHTSLSTSPAVAASVHKIALPLALNAMIEAEQVDASAYVESVAGRLRGAGVQVRCETPEGPAATAILDRANGIGADLIAMTTHGRSGLANLVFGSVAEEVLHRAPCPVLLVRVRERS